MLWGIGGWKSLLHACLYVFCQDCAEASDLSTDSLFSVLSIPVLVWTELWACFQSDTLGTVILIVQLILSGISFEMIKQCMPKKGEKVVLISSPFTMCPSFSFWGPVALEPWSRMRPNFVGNLCISFDHSNYSEVEFRRSEQSWNGKIPLLNTAMMVA